MTLSTRFPAPPACNPIIRSILNARTMKKSRERRKSRHIKLFSSNPPRELIKINRRTNRAIPSNSRKETKGTANTNTGSKANNKKPDAGWDSNLKTGYKQDRRIWLEARISPKFWNAPPLFPRLIESARPATRERSRATYETYAPSAGRQRPQQLAFIASNIADGTFTFSPSVERSWNR